MLGPGAVVGKYRIEGVLGRGGMGIVYEATQLSLNRRLALKVLHADLARDPAFVERFRREGRIQASIDHPHIVPVYEAEETEHGLLLAMRLVPGTTLATLISAGGLGAGRALRLLGQVASALDAAHAAGLVHRDVKPQNVLVDDADHAYLADFGLTKVGVGSAVTGAGSVTSTGPMLGTIAYLAPEVIRGEPATPASDRYALAAVMFECLSGTVLYPRSSDLAVLYAHTSETVPSITERRPELPSGLDDVLTAGLAKNPNDRPTSAAAIVSGAAEALGAEAIATLGPPERDAALVPTAAVPAAAGRRRSRRPIAAGVVALALAVGAFFIGGELRSSPRVEAKPLVPKGAQSLGSDLTSGGRTVDCNGRTRTALSPACSIVQASLPGRLLVVPRDGAIYGWSVRGAKGEIRMQVLRERDGAFQVARSLWEYASNERVHTFTTNLTVEAGDFIGIVLGNGGAVGVRRTDGATTKRWVPPRKGSPAKPPTLGTGTGFDYEILFRVDYYPGAKQQLPPQIRGDEAAAAPAGTVRLRKPLKFTDGRAVDVALVELPDRVVFDLFAGGRRVARMDVPDLAPGGDILVMDTYAYDDAAAEGESGVTWTNPYSGRVIDHFMGVLPHGFSWFI